MKSNSYTLVPVSDVLNQICRFWPECAVDSRHLMPFLEQQNGWNHLGNCESDTEIFAALMQLGQMDGQVVVICDLSYRPHFGAFVLDSVDLPEFVSSFDVTFGECLFNGDVFIAQSERQQLLVFHHEGVIARFGSLRH